MGRICAPCKKDSAEEVSLLEADDISPEVKFSVRRALKCVCPHSTRLYRYIRASTKLFFPDAECRIDFPESEPSIPCDCTEDSSELDSFCNLFKSKCVCTEAEIQRLINVIETKLREELNKRVIVRYCRKCRAPDYCIVPVIVRSSGDSESSDTTELLCSCEPVSPTCSETKALECKCKTRPIPLEFRHFGHLLEPNAECLESHRQPFKLPDVGKSDLVAKWGAFFEIVERALRLRDWMLHSSMNACCTAESVCRIPRLGDDFDNLDRFKNVEIFGMPMFCRGLIKWSNCVTKRWQCLISHPHIVIHLPSMGYPYHLRCASERKFESLQNIQIGRLGWLINKNTTVIYVCPGKTGIETKCILESFVKLARPDVSQSRLWIIENDEKCYCKEVDEEYRSGCESLFYTPNVYRRVRHLSAGRRGLIIPGVLSKTDVFIACELRTSILGPCLSFQDRLLNKRYAMSGLARAGIQHPPFLPVRNYDDLCDKLALFIAMLPTCGCRARKWLVRVNRGFGGHQNAFIHLDRGDCSVGKEELPYRLAEVLPRKLKPNKKAYKDSKDFLLELERHGGLLTACPTTEHKTVSLGCFLEHDLAEAGLRVSADVVREPADAEGDAFGDVGYVIPQTSLPEATMRELVLRVGEFLQTETYVGFFGVDLLVFEDEHNVYGDLKYWVVDIDPYYTDLLSFDDWRRFCLDITDCESANDPPPKCSNDRRKIPSPEHDRRSVVCSGKLYAEGLALASGDYLVDLCRGSNIAYSSKAKSGCMMCPLDREKRAHLLFSFARTREIALEHFVRALRALHDESTRKLKYPHRPATSDLLKLAKSMQATYGIRI